MGIVLDSTNSPLPHPSEEILEGYVLRRLPEALADTVDEHLLFCHSCQDALLETGRFVSAFKATADPQYRDAGAGRSGWLRVRPSLALAPAFLLLVMAFLAVQRHRSQKLAAAVEVSLSSLRGTNVSSSAPAGKPLKLSIEAPDLISGGPYRAEVVDATGDQVWKGAVLQNAGKLVATVAPPLRPGVFWVRLYETDSKLLREFSLSVK